MTIASPLSTKPEGTKKAGASDETPAFYFTWQLIKSQGCLVTI